MWVIPGSQMLRGTVISLLILWIVNRGNARRIPNFDDIRLDKEGFDRAQALHHSWYSHSIKALMGQLGKDLNKRLNKDDRRIFLRCLDEIPDRSDIISPAKCLVNAREKFMLYKRTERKHRLSFPTESYVLSTESKSKAVISKSFEVLNALLNKKKLPPAKPTASSRSSSTNANQKLIRKIIKFRPRNNHQTGPVRQVLRKPKAGYDLKKKLFSLEEKFRFRRVKRSPYRLIDSISKSGSFKYNVERAENVPFLKDIQEKTPVQKVTGMIRKLMGPGDNSESKWMDTYENLLRLKKAMDRRAKDPGAKVYDMRMLDLVVGNRYATPSAYDKPFLPPLVHEAYDLISAVDKSHKSTSDGINVKFLSPRFAPVMPDRTESRGKLSPSILSFYKDETEDQILPIPKLLEATGMSDKDRQSILETVMEISGAKDTVKDAIKVLENMNFFGMEGELKEVTEQIAGNFKALEESFNLFQRKEIKRRGFTFLEPDQLTKLYSKQGILQRDDLPLDIQEYKTLTRKQREEALWLRIEQIAANSTNTTDIDQRRSKRQISWLNVLKPTVLSPYMFSPVFGLTVLGPTVLSPSIFSPTILNPALLSPAVLSPAIAMPFILSPYVLTPYVLSPMVMAPFVLTPYVLSPNVINPYVMSPLVLSPLVLCPDLMSPQVLGGGILSPAVASPSVFSKSVLMASVLSPSVLS